MKILFMGTPEFAVPSLVKLHEAGHEIAGVIAQPDRPKGRGMKMQFPPVKERALSLGLPVFQPDTLKDGALMPLLESLAPELIVVVAYGKILPAYVLDAPKMGAINLHGSLLPAYRGAAPVQRAVVDGCETVGVTTMFMAEALDAGDMLLRAELKIGEYDTSGEVAERLMVLGASLLVKTVRLLHEGELTPEKQDERLVTYAPIIKKEEGRIDWKKGAVTLINHIRGMNPWPVAFTGLGDETIKIYRAVRAESMQADAPPGTIVSLDKEKGLVVACGAGALVVTELQAPGGKKMPAVPYAVGHPDIIGRQFL